MEFKLYSQGVNVYILYLQFLRESKVTTNSARTETGLLTNNVASACNELVHSKVVMAVDDKFSSASQSCPTLCDPMGCSTPGLTEASPAPGVHPNPCPSSQ